MTSSVIFIKLFSKNKTTYVKKNGLDSFQTVFSFPMIKGFLKNQLKVSFV